MCRDFQGERKLRIFTKMRKNGSTDKPDRGRDLVMVEIKPELLTESSVPYHKDRYQKKVDTFWHDEIFTLHRASQKSFE